MNRKVFSGGIYADALPTGEFVVGFEGNKPRLQTHLGDISLPPTGDTLTLFNRITNVGGFRIATKTPSTDRVWVYSSSNSSWAEDGRISHGVQGHAWAPDGRLFVVEPGGAQETQGLRYWDLSAPADIANLDLSRKTVGFVTGSPSYNPITPLARHYGVQHIYEWTRISDGIFIGQGAEGGAVIQHTGLNKHFLLESGDVRFIQAHRSGDVLAVAITKLAQREAVIIVLSVTQIPSLPEYSTKPEPRPEPKPDPQPEPKPVPDVLRDRQSLVESIRQELFNIGPNEPLNSAHKAFQITKRVAWELRGEGWGLVRAKPGSDNNVEGFTSDVIALRDGEHVDVIAASEAGGFAAWQPVRFRPDFEQSWNDAIAPRWTAPIPPDEEPQPRPEPNPDPKPKPQPEPKPPVLPEELKDYIDDSIDYMDSILAGIKIIERETAAIKAQMERGFEARVFGTRIVFTPIK